MARPASFRSTSLTLTLLAAALLAPAAARANGFALDIQGVFSNGTATAGAASTHDAAGMLANPAVIAHLEGFNLVAGGMLIAPKAPFTEGGGTSEFTGQPGAQFAPGGNNGDGSKTGAAPWLFAAYRVTPDLAVGFSFYAPFGQKTDYGRTSNFVGRFQGVESTIESVAFGPAVAWRPLPQVAIGVSAAARRDSATMGNTLNEFALCLAGAMKQGVPEADAPGYCVGTAGVNPGDEGYGRYKADAWGWTATGGITVEPVAGTLIGAAYRHESTSKVKGNLSLDARTQGLLGLTTDPAATMKLQLPDFATVSLEQKLGKTVQLLAAFQYTLWSRFDQIEIVPTDASLGVDPIVSKQGYKNAFRVSGAGVWTATPGVDLFAGVAFEQSPIQTKYRQVTLAERDSLIAGVGAEAKVWRNLTVSACYQRVQMLGTSKLDYTDPETLTRVQGSVKGSANVGAFQIGWKG